MLLILLHQPLITLHVESMVGETTWAKHHSRSDTGHLLRHHSSAATAAGKTNRPMALFVVQSASTAGHDMHISWAHVAAAALEQVISSMGACQMLYACRIATAS